MLRSLVGSEMCKKDKQYIIKMKIQKFKNVNIFPNKSQTSRTSKNLKHKSNKKTSTIKNIYKKISKLKKKKRQIQKKKKTIKQKKKKNYI